MLLELAGNLNAISAATSRVLQELPDNLPAKETTKQTDLFHTVLQLPEKYRIPIHLFYYEEYSVKQIASVMDLPEATVKVRLKRGREKLGKLLQKEEWM